MARPNLLQSDYSRGSISDLARHLLPRGSAYRITDYLVGHGAPLSKRGGFTYASPVLGTNARTLAVAYAPFSGGAQRIAITEDGHLWKVDSVSAATDKGAGHVPIQRPVFFNNALILPGATPRTYDGTTLAALGGTPPGGVYGFAYKGRLYLGGSAANPNRLWPSDILNASLWNLSTGYIDLTDPLRGAAPLRNAILCWSDGRTERIRGDVPPPGGDMVKEPLFEEGCIDARSIVVYGDRAIWANSNGVFISDGAALQNLIELGGQQQFWADTFAGYTSSWTVAGGIARGQYVIVVLDTSTTPSTLKLAMMCDLDSKTWTFLSNVKATMFAEAYGAAQELYFSMRDQPRLGAFSSVFVPQASVANDADGVAVQPVIETAFFRGTPGSRRWKNIRVSADIAAASTATYLELAYVTAPELSAYTVLPDTIPANSGYDRHKIPFGQAGDGFGLRIRQVGASYTTQLFDLEAEIADREGSRS